MADPIKAAKPTSEDFLSKADPAAMPDSERNAKDPQAQLAALTGAVEGGLAKGVSLSARKRQQIAKKASAAKWARNSPQH